MKRARRVQASTSTRAATVAAQAAFPLKALVWFFDSEQAHRMGEVIGHAKGCVVIESPPWKRGGAVSRAIWELIKLRHRVEPRRVQLVR